MLSFEFEHVFSAPSPAALFAAYFDPAHQLEQDRRTDIREREIISLDDSGDQLRRVCRVVPDRQLPIFIRPLIRGSLQYIETALWKRADDVIEIDIRPSILNGRAHIAGTYRLDVVGPNAIRRRYEGTVSVDVPLIASRIERGMVAELARSMPVTAECTQAWLDHHSVRSVAARA
jgi:hypothetical protein